MSKLDLDRLHLVVENINDINNEARVGKTTALLHQMLGCAELGEPDTNWLYITSYGWQEADRVIYLFAELLQANDIPFDFVKPSHLIITKLNGAKRFFFKSIEGLEQATRGILYDAIFDDVNVHELTYRAYTEYQYAKEYIRIHG